MIYVEILAVFALLLTILMVGIINMAISIKQWLKLQEEENEHKQYK